MKTYKPTKVTFLSFITDCPTNGKFGWITKGSNPEEDITNVEDDWWTSNEGFTGIEGALKDLEKYCGLSTHSNTEWKAIVNFQTKELCLISAPTEREIVDGAENEFARQQGMGLGLRAYNEARGRGSNEY